MRIYLDNAATTPLAPEVIDTMVPFMQSHYGNPSSIHAQGRKARAAIETARKSIANHLNASIGEIFFTSGGTESNNMALRCAVRDLGVRRIISSPLEHHCVLHTLEELAEQVEVVLLDIVECGKIDYNQLEGLIEASEVPTLVTLMHANNETGTLLDLSKVAELCKAKDVYLHSDTVQTMGHYPFDVEELPIHFFSGSAHKFHGPKGIGFIYINGDVQIKPLIHGGSQERNMRAGTENIYGIIGLAKAFELANEEMQDRQNQITELRSYLANSLLDNFEDIQFDTDWAGESLYTVLNVSFPPSPNSDLLLLNLDIAGIAASGGSACSSGSEKGSHVITEIHGQTSRKNIRFSFSHYNTQKEIDQLIVALRKVVATKKAGVAQ